MKYLIIFIGIAVLPFSYAAEIMVKKGNDASGTYEDGDIMFAVNDKGVWKVHAERIVKTRPILKQRYFESVYEYKFERISSTEVKRTNLSSSEWEIFSNTPNGKGERINVPLYIERRKKTGGALFGSPGSEVWYGGESKAEDSDIDSIWVEIEKETSFKKADYGGWPFTDKEKEKYAIIRSQNFTDAQSREFVSPVLSETINASGLYETIKHRKYYIDYKSVQDPNALNNLSIITEKQ